MFDYSGRNCHALQMKRKGNEYLIISMKRDKQQQQPQYLLSNERERRVFKFISLYFFFHIYTTHSKRTKKKQGLERKKGYHNRTSSQLTHTHIYIDTYIFPPPHFHPAYIFYRIINSRPKLHLYLYQHVDSIINRN